VRIAVKYASIGQIFVRAWIVDAFSIHFFSLKFSGSKSDFIKKYINFGRQGYGLKF